MSVFGVSTPFDGVGVVGDGDVESENRLLQRSFVKSPLGGLTPFNGVRAESLYSGITVVALKSFRGRVPKFLSCVSQTQIKNVGNLTVENIL